MEVHHHGHVHHTKKWKDYAYQFLMLFIAVFCGGLAENQRDHQMEREREEEYAVSMIEDLDQDIKNIQVDLADKQQKIRDADSLTALLIDGDYVINSKLIYYMARKFSVKGYIFHMTDGTLMELKNSGGLRLIQKQAVVDSLQAYYNLYQHSEDEQEFADISLSNYRDIMVRIFDVKVFDTMIDNFPVISMPEGNPKLFNSDPELMNEFLMRVQLTKTVEGANIRFLGELKESALRLIDQIKRDYKLSP